MLVAGRHPTPRPVLPDVQVLEQESCQVGGTVAGVSALRTKLFGFQSHRGKNLKLRKASRVCCRTGQIRGALWRVCSLMNKVLSVGQGYLRLREHTPGRPQPVKCSLSCPSLPYFVLSCSVLFCDRISIAQARFSLSLLTDGMTGVSHHASLLATGAAAF